MPGTENSGMQISNTGFGGFRTKKTASKQFFFEKKNQKTFTGLVYATGAIGTQL
jgi:hypothetical protein